MPEPTFTRHPVQYVDAAALLPQAQEDVKHLLRQGLEFCSGHPVRLLISIIEFSGFIIISNIEFVKGRGWNPFGQALCQQIHILFTVDPLTSSNSRAILIIIP